MNNVGAFTRRFRATSKRAVAREVAFGAGGTSMGNDPGLAGSTLSPSGVAMEHEQAMALRRALERLPEEYRRVVVLRFEEGRSFEEIGRLTGRSPDAARKVWSRAMERLRQEWEGPTRPHGQRSESPETNDDYFRWLADFDDFLAGDASSDCQTTGPRSRCRNG